MILLGSVERKELIKIIAKQISRERRLHVANQWHQEVKALRMQQEEAIYDAKSQRSFQRSSQIEVCETGGTTNNVYYMPADDSRLSSTCWDDDGLKNRRSSRVTIAFVETAAGNPVELVNNTSADNEKMNEMPQVTNLETITSNSSGEALLESVKEALELLPLSSCTSSKKVNKKSKTDASY